MTNNMTYETVTTLLYKLTVGQLSEAERRQLDQWVAERPEREVYIRQLTSPDFLEKEYRELKSIDYRQTMARMEERIKETGAEREQATDRSASEKRGRILRIAAAIALLVVGGALVWYTQYTKVTPPEIAPEVIAAMQRSQQSGRVGADAQPISHTSPRAKSEGEQLPSGTTGEGYHSSVQEDADVEEGGFANLLNARRVTTYHDKEFWLTLDDGTLVHLNYNTRVIYPEKFSRSKREVFLDGEAYFMVAKDRSRPFIVKTHQGDVKVYGTEFWMTTRGESAEEKEEKLATTQVVLVKGSVGITPTGRAEQMMKPGQQCSITNGQWSMNEVNLEPFIAWNTGNYVFENATLERLMNVVAHWYGYEVVFRNEKARHKLFTGEFDKYSSFEPMLEAIRTVTDADIHISGEQIVIQ